MAGHRGSDLHCHHDAAVGRRGALSIERSRCTSTRGALAPERIAATNPVGRQNTVGSSQRRTLQSCYKNGLMLGLIWSVFTWLRSFIRSRHDLGLEIVALRQQLMVLKRQTKRAHLTRPLLLPIHRRTLA